jgi:lysophospholipid acyltransferase (LPLAT)-like uncharacterized protein
MPRAAACWGAAGYLRLVHATGNWSVEGEEIPRRLIDEGRPFIVCFWHGRLLLVSEAWHYERRFHMVISQHPDGQLIANTIVRLGFDTISGSTTHGGTAVLRAMHDALQAGECVGITPDGPQGPRMRAGAGIVQAARMVQVPIVPLACAAAPRHQISNWDRLLVPLPFGRGVVKWGEPVEIARDANEAAVEDTRRTLEERMNAMTRTLDEQLGLPPVEPQPTETEADTGADG